VETGIAPDYLCYNPQYNKVYVSTYSNNVTVIDGATNHVLATVPTGNGPIALCYSSQNGDVYCVNQYSSNVTVINCETDSVDTTVAVGSEPWDVCYNPRDNKVYTANHGGGSVTVIDCETNQVDTTVACGYQPAVLCYDSLNNRVYCANSGDGTVTVIDGGTNQVVKTMSGVEASDLAWNSIENRIYASGYYSSKITVIRDSIPVGIEETPSAEVQTTKSATVVGGVLFLPANGGGQRANGALLDAAGRKVLDLAPGANDVSRLAPGVYFIRERGTMREGRATTKVVIQK
jgi:YVTN family beta-propeller protein